MNSLDARALEIKAIGKITSGYVSDTNANIHFRDFATVANFPLVELLVSILTVQGKWADFLDQLRRFSTEKISTKLLDFGKRDT